MKKTAVLFFPFLLLLAASLLSITEQKCEEECRHQRLSRNSGGPAGEERDNPYVFGEESFESRVRSEHGRVRVLKKFSSLSPHFLSRIENYRLGLLEADPLTFIMPTHLDADSVFYVIEGEGAISILHEGSRESHSLEKGDIIRVWSGSIFYLINKSHDRKLRIVKLLQTVGTNPGGVEVINIVT
ncbi:Globulin-1 S allele [Platanthera zijinensis]|uniref:Globulin-1 S allele n=1 Tax=Platanthera zijinensis TaxID=2320716 RepID=A0AAP0FWC3_9ASPA